MKKYMKKDKLSLIITIFVLSFLTGVVSVLRGSDFLSIFFSFILFFSFLVFFLKYKDQVLAKIILLSFLIRGFLAYFQRFISPLPDSTADAVGFERHAWLFAEEGITRGGAYRYSQVIGWFYSLFGRTPLLAQFINVLLGTLLVFFIYKITLTLFERKRTAHIASLISAFFPVLALYSAITMRELVIVFPFALSFYFFSLWLKKGRFKRIILSFLFIFVSSLSHGAMILIAASYFFFFLFYKPLKKRWTFFKKESLIILLIFLISFSIFFSFFRSKIPSPQDFSPERLERQVTRATRDRAAYLEGLYPESYTDIVLQTPVRIVYFFFSPMRVEQRQDIFGAFDAFLYFSLFILSFLVLLKLWKKNKETCLAFLFTLAIFAIVFSWGVSNYGTAIRHRQKIVFLLIIFSSFYITKIYEKNSLFLNR